MKKILLLLLTILLIAPSIFFSQEGRFQKTLEDDNSKFTDVGNIAITITNFGVYGHAFSLWPQQPNCEYPIGSGIEHIYDGGLWIGGYKADDSLNSNISGPFVTTAATDPVDGENGVEFTTAPSSVVRERSSLIESAFFDPAAVSHQDFFMEFTDTNKTSSNGELIVAHNPYGVSVRQETYAWDFPFANFFVIFNYWIKNVSNKYLDSVYIGLWTDTVVRNTNVTSPRTGTAFFNKGGNGFNDSLSIGYEFDAAGDVGFSDSYIGIQLLGASQNYDSTNYVTWQYRSTTDPNFFTPQNDISRYRKLEGYFGGSNRFNSGIRPSTLKLPSNRSTMVSAGPFDYIAPGDSVNIVFAIVGAKKFGTEPTALDTEEQKKNLYDNAGWAIRAYNGEDRNGNGILEPEEDFDGDGKITRYILPSPPQNPRVKVIPENQRATIYWDKRAEDSIDPISAKKDFEGYRVYRTNSGFDLTESQDLNSALVKMAEFDSLGNDVGYNTGFSFVELDEPVVFPDDTVKYYYKYEVENLLNGWQYLFSVTAFDEGDTENNLGSLESGKLSGVNRILPGTPAVEEDETEIGIYPNPYYGNAYWDGSSERLRKIYFFNLPANAEITIYTLSGDIVDVIEHNSSSNGNDLRWFETFSREGNQVMAGGEHAWDLITRDDQAIATGLYLFTVKNLNTGNIKRGKFLVIK